MNTSPSLATGLPAIISRVNRPASPVTVTPVQGGTPSQPTPGSGAPDATYEGSVPSNPVANDEARLRELYQRNRALLTAAQRPGSFFHQLGQVTHGPPQPTSGQPRLLPVNPSTLPRPVNPWTSVAIQGPIISTRSPQPTPVFRFPFP